METALDHLDPATHSIVAEIVQLSDGIRGYELIKLDNIRAVKDRAQKLTGLLREPKVPAA